jgi:8-oxo-dGTP pyrophosphatase MutT (NUDIX family)
VRELREELGIEVRPATWVLPQASTASSSAA